MHFVTGGAFNGKSKWVKANNLEVCCWISAYHGESLPTYLDQVKESTIVLEGIEQWVKQWLEELNEDDVRKKWQSLLQQLRSWENRDKCRKVILIGTDLTKGIVPLHRSDREWRDVCGRVFQDTALSCERVDLIWYGLNKRLK
ncbi:bifunctional adenosylcobinamide kinase/adenosylcobinamide-phosphate guanylyltransferase [Niallia sp. Krafla_26]|uniref:bifunctional adenosylcobinamide kinase/adenosylcobinamide-phosphate guanylyltransferase n=1 Tax=Niallia sp. Krafla_26 TaxID=3064703 RepID=UPI003D16BAB5